MIAISYAFAHGVHMALYRYASGAFCVRWDPSAGATRAVTAADERGRLVGILVFSLRRGRMRSWLTYVGPRARRQGVGRKLWRLALGELAPRRVSVTVVSDRGLALVTAVAAEHPRVCFSVSESGRRKLRAA